MNNRDREGFWRVTGGIVRSREKPTMRKTVNLLGAKKSWIWLMIVILAMTVVLVIAGFFKSNKPAESFLSKREEKEVKNLIYGFYPYLSNNRDVEISIRGRVENYVKVNVSSEMGGFAVGLLKTDSGSWEKLWAGQDTPPCSWLEDNPQFIKVPAGIVCYDVDSDIERKTR